MIRSAKWRWVVGLEVLGVRYLSNLMAWAFRDEPLPPYNASPTAHTWSAERLRSTSDTARYYAWANLLRGLVYLPLIHPIAESGVAFSHGFVVALVVFHVVCLLIELHKHFLLRSLSPSANPVTPTPRVTPETLQPSNWFTPRPWETPEFYKRVGIEGFREFVRAYDRRTRGADPALPANLAVMEVDSRISEGMHWTAVGLNIPFYYALILSGSPWILLVVAIFLGDLYLVMLQRYHRVRIRSTASRRRRRPSDRTPESDPKSAC